jgi:hypothetical protein
MPDRRVVRERLQTFGHFLTGLVILLKGISKLEHAEGHIGSIAFFFAAAVYVFAATALHRRFHRHEAQLQASIYLIESAVLGIIAWMYVEQGKRWLQYPAAFASAAFLLAPVIALTMRGRRRGAAAEVPGEIHGA